MSAGATVFIVILVMLVTVSWIGLFLARSSLKKCETRESPSCPSYFCNNTNKICQPDATATSGAAFRTDANGNIQCQTYTLAPNVNSRAPNERLNNNTWNPSIRPIP